jgi:hypothetical protein
MKKVSLLLISLFFLFACEDKSEPDLNRPPGAFSVSSVISGTDLILTWDKAEDNNAVTYSVVYGDTLARNLTSTTYIIKSVPYNTEIKGNVIAVNSRGLSTSSSFSIKTDQNPELYVSLYDTNFEQALIDLKLDDIKDGRLLRENAVKVLELNLANKSITDVRGIEAFTSLRTLWLTDNQVSMLDISKNVLLEYLYLSSNNLSTLDISNNPNLIQFYVSHNRLQVLDLSKNTNLHILGCDNNRFTVLNLSKNLNLRNLDVYSNQLKELNVSANVKLRNLDAYDNQLTELNVRNNTDLRMLDVYRNELTTLDVSKNINLTLFRCTSNRIDTICVNSLSQPREDWQKDASAEYKVCN